MFARSLAALFAIAALVGCQAYKLVSPGPTPVTGGYSVTPTAAWNKATVMGDERWTTEGNVLQEVAFADIGHGDRLFNAPIHTPAFPPGVIVSRVGENKLPAYRADMTLFDVKDFIEATLVQVGALNVSISDMRPAKFGALDGFRIDIGYNMKTGLARRGFIVGVQTGGRLKLIIYSAAEVFYYARNLPEAERLVASVQFAGAVAPAENAVASAMPAAAAPAVQSPPQPANPNLVALPPRPDGAPRRTPVYTAGPAPAPATASAGGALPPCSSVTQLPESTKSIADSVGGRSNLARIDVAPKPTTPCVDLPPCSSVAELPEGTTTIANSVGGRSNLAPVVAATPCAPAPSAAAPSAIVPIVRAAPLPPCS
ncbi:MAG: lipoprotein, partial [Rhodospirillales bacterium]|nr:lipoprotein [Rhodospirillales bacterium]